MRNDSIDPDELKRFPRLPPSPPASAEPSPLTKSLIAAMAAGSGSYFLLPELLGYGHIGSSDELSALLAALSVGILSSIKFVRALCDGMEETTEESALNLAKGGISGFGLGLSIASVTAAALISVVDGGIILATTLAGTAGAVAANRVKKLKRCPHCSEKGQCSQKICRYCHKIFFPL